MRILLALTIIASLFLPMTVLAGGGDPTGGDPCHDRAKGCTDVNAGTMDCLPEAGIASESSSVVGSADSGTFHLVALGTNHGPGADPCQFEVRVRAADIQFNEGWTVGLLAPYGGVTSTSSSPCLAYPGQQCQATATFTWWRAQHGVTFDIPYDLLVNGILVAKGKVHYYDPPAFETVTGAPVVV